MARSRGPGNLIARRSSYHERADGDARQSYDGMIASDLGGRRKTSYRAIDDGRPVATAQLLLRPLSLFLMACTAFAIVLAAWAWQSGLVGRAQLSLNPPRPPESSAWMGARRPAATAAAATAPRPVQAVATPNATDADESDADEPSD